MPLGILLVHMVQPDDHRLRNHVTLDQYQDHRRSHEYGSWPPQHHMWHHMDSNRTSLPIDMGLVS